MSETQAESFEVTMTSTADGELSEDSVTQIQVMVFALVLL